jgi:hypothetical protein
MCRLRRMVIAADRTCRTPWCDAPIRHIDHPLRAADGGPTSLDNSAGLCEACNYAKEALGFQCRSRPGRILEIITPTGHRSHSRPPAVIGTSPLLHPRTLLDADPHTLPETNPQTAVAADLQSPLEAKLAALITTTA